MILSFLLVTLAVARDYDYNLDDSILFEQFKKDFRREYNTLAEELQRRLFFMNTLKIIREHNRNQSSYTMGINKFADRGPEEMAIPKQAMKSALKAQKKMNVSGAFPYQKSVGIILPDNYSLCTSEAKTNYCGSFNIDQGLCGSCYAIASAHYMSTWYSVLLNGHGEISPEPMIDCEKNSINKGCCGGNSYYIFKEMEYFYALDDDTKYRYKNQKDDNCCTYKCSVKNKPVLKKVNFYYQEKELSWEQVKFIIKEYNGFVANMYAPDSLSYYTGGIYSPSECKRTGHDVNHAIVVDGYGIDNGNKYLWVRNSWGNDWGIENGHFKIDFNNRCLINTIDSAFCLVKAQLT